MCTRDHTCPTSEPPPCGFLPSSFASLLFLSLSQGPHIASVTLAAYECSSTDFPEPPYPDQIVCPQAGGVEGSISLWSIMSKVRLEACMWVSNSLITRDTFSYLHRRKQCLPLAQQRGSASWQLVQDVSQFIFLSTSLGMWYPAWVYARSSSSRALRCGFSSGFLPTWNGEDPMATTTKFGIL